MSTSPLETISKLIKASEEIPELSSATEEAEAFAAMALALEKLKHDSQIRVIHMVSTRMSHLRIAGMLRESSGALKAAADYLGSVKDKLATP